MSFVHRIVLQDHHGIGLIVRASFRSHMSAGAGIVSRVRHRVVYYRPVASDLRAVSGKVEPDRVMFFAR